MLRFRAAIQSNDEVQDHANSMYTYTNIKVYT